MYLYVLNRNYIHGEEECLHPTGAGVRAKDR